MEEAVFDRIVSGFYAAATGDCSWDTALLPVQQALRLSAAVLHPYAPATGQILGLHLAGGPGMDRAMLEYLSQYHRIDPRRTLGLRLAQELGPELAGRWVHCHEHLSEDFMQRDRFFQSFMSAYDTRYNAHISLPINDELHIGFGLEIPASRGPLNADERETVRRLGTHLHDALRAYERLRRLMQQALASHKLLMQYPYPMWLLDEQRGIAFENPAALAERQTERRVRMRGERLVLCHTATEQAFANALTALRLAGQDATAVLDLRATRADPPQWLHLSLMVPEATLGAFGQRPMVLATLFDPAQVSPLDTYALAQMFQLTPAEAKVAARLADGLTAEQIGTLHHTAETTVRTQIRQVLAKLGARRLTDVVRMLRQGEALWSLSPAAAARVSAGPG